MEMKTATDDDETQSEDIIASSAVTVKAKGL